MGKTHRIKKKRLTSQKNRSKNDVTGGGLLFGLPPIKQTNRIGS